MIYTTNTDIADATKKIPICSIRPIRKNW